MEFKVSAALPFEPKIFMACERDSKVLSADEGACALLKTHLLPLLHMDAAPVDVKASKGFLGGLLKGRSD
ncbi:MAG: hypothetical protein ACPGRX_01955, partial [Bdellovibrionales bacterium]